MEDNSYQKEFICIQTLVGKTDLQSINEIINAKETQKNNTGIVGLSNWCRQGYKFNPLLEMKTKKYYENTVFFNKTLKIQHYKN